MKRLFHCLIPLALIAGFSGCATTPAAFDYNGAKPVKIDSSKYKQATVSLSAKEGVVMTDSEKSQMADFIRTELKKQITTLKIPADAAAPDGFSLSVTITRFEKGNAFARAMLIGLGQIHIDADIVVKDLTTGNVIAAYSVKKTFAWGGIYGGITRMEDVEPAFAAGVVNGITGKEDSDQKS